MKNYFETQRINWSSFSPKDIIFKSNKTIKKLLPAENILSYTTKTDRNDKMCKLSGGKRKKTKRWNGQDHVYWSRDKYKAIHVKLTNVTSDFPCATIDIVNYTERHESSGAKKPSIDALVYISSYHFVHKWEKDSNGNWDSVKESDIPLPDAEGYRISYGGQGSCNPFSYKEFIEVVDISQSVINFLVDRVLPLKNGTLVEEWELGEKVMVA